MKIDLHVCGRLKEPYLRAAEDEYRKRLRPYCTLSVAEHKSDAALAKAIPSDGVLYAFDERGRDLTSREFAQLIDRHAQFGSGAALCFAIGGADGHSDALRQRAKGLIALGRMTIAHRLVRIVVLEQIYRAHRILRGQPYHRD